MKPHVYATIPAPRIDHRANRLLAALEPDDFAALEPHLHGISLRQDQVLYETAILCAMPPFLMTPWYRWWPC